MFQPMNNKAQSVRTLQIIWGALLVSIYLYLIVLKFTLVNPVTEVDLTPEFQQSWHIFFGLATLSLAVSFFLPRLMLKKLKEQKPTEFSLMAQLYSTPFVVSLALTEAVALIGFAFAFINKNPDHYIPFLALSTVVYLMRFPTEGKIKAIFQAKE